MGNQWQNSCALPCNGVGRARTASASRKKGGVVWMFGDLAEGRADSYSGCLRLASRLAHNVVEIGTQARTVAWLRRIGLGRRRDCEMHVTEMPCDLKAIRHNGRKLDTGGDALVQ